MYLIFGIVFLIIEVLMIFIFLFGFYKKKMELSKKNNCFFIPVAILIFSVYCVNLSFMKNGASYYDYIYLMGRTLKFLVFDIDSAKIYEISKAIPLYHVVYTFLFLIVSLTWITTFFSLFGSKIMNGIYVNKLLKNGCDIVIGYSKDSIQYCLNNKNSVLWLESSEKKEIEDLKKKKLKYLNCKLNNKTLNHYIKNKTCHIIYFNISSLNLQKELSKYNFTENKKEIYLHFATSVEQMKFIRDVYFELNLEKSQVYLSCFNKHELLAREFVKLYPISKYVPREFYNSNLTIKNGKRINICFIGFGKVNMALFKMMSTIFQFAVQKKDKLEVLPVNYYIFESEEEKLHNDCFTKLEFDFEHIFKNCDLPKIEKICNVEYKQVYAETAELKRKLVDLVNENSYTYFVVSLTNDSENMEYAKSLYYALEELKQNFAIFCRIKDNNIQDLNCISNNVIYFGEDQNFLNHDRIVNDNLMKIAGLVNSSYRSLSSADFHRAWQKEPIVEQYSNIFGALIVYHKMGMMNLEIVNQEDSRRKISKEEYEKYYGSVDFNRNNELYNQYDFYFKTTVKNVLAFVEHSRWNASYFYFDFKPMNYKDFYYNEEKKRFEHKDIIKKKHACLTTYYALDELIKEKYKMIKVYKKESSEIDYTDPDFISIAQIYRYDYMVLDNLFTVLDELSLKLVRK